MEVKKSVVIQAGQLVSEDYQQAIQRYSRAFRELCWYIHLANVQAGWWKEGVERNYGELIALCHSELSESLEGDRKSLQDDHLPQYAMRDVELIDTFIRIADILGASMAEQEGAFDPGDALVDKLMYNRQRKDHKPEAREAEGGKAY